MISVTPFMVTARCVLMATASSIFIAPINICPKQPKLSLTGYSPFISAISYSTYLHLYRRPLSRYFTRRSFAQRWQALSFDAKETAAANIRRHLTEISNAPHSRDQDDRNCV